MRAAQTVSESVEKRDRQTAGRTAESSGRMLVVKLAVPRVVSTEFHWVVRKEAQTAAQWAPPRAAWSVERWAERRDNSKAVPTADRRAGKRAAKWARQKVGHWAL